MVGHGGSSAGSYLADPTSPIPSHCQKCPRASIITCVHTINLCLNLNSQESTKLHQTPHSPNQPLIQPINQSITFHSHLTQSTNQQINQSINHSSTFHSHLTYQPKLLQYTNDQWTRELSFQPTNQGNKSQGKLTNQTNQSTDHIHILHTNQKILIIHSPKKGL